MKERRLLRPFLLWLLYWPGTHPDALHFGLKVALAAAVPMAGHYEGGAHGGQFDGFALISVSGDGTQQDNLYLKQVI